MLLWTINERRRLRRRRRNACMSNSLSTLAVCLLPLFKPRRSRRSLRQYEYYWKSSNPGGDKNGTFERLETYDPVFAGKPGARNTDAIKLSPNIVSWNVWPSASHSLDRLYYWTKATSSMRNGTLGYRKEQHENFCNDWRSQVFRNPRWEGKAAGAISSQDIQRQSSANRHFQSFIHSDRPSRPFSKRKPRMISARTDLFFSQGGHPSA